jgi:hypothetical protein
VKELPAVFHGGSLGGHLGVNKIVDKVRQRYYWLRSRSDIEKWCKQWNTVQQAEVPEPGVGA